MKSQTTIAPSKWGAALLVLAVYGLTAFWLFKGRSLGWDELEHARATAWTAEGRVPFRDFWEHHTPLQWHLMAPLRRLGPRAGIEAIIWLRAVQALIWQLGLLAAAGMLGAERKWSAPAYAALLSAFLSATFVLWAVEYRPETIGTCAMAAALWAWRTGAPGRSHFLTGLFLAASVLANLRLALPAAGMAALLAATSPAERQWGLRPKTVLPLVLGLALPAAIWLFYLIVTRSLSDAWISLAAHNRLFNEDVFHRGRADFTGLLLHPVTHGDVAGAFLLLWMLVATAVNLRKFCRPDLDFALSCLQLLQLAALAALGVHYPYHLQGILFFAALQWALFAAESRLKSILALIVAGLLTAFGAAHAAFGNFHAQLEAQRKFMAELSARVPPEQTVFDGVGYALDRAPACELWFLAAPARLVAAAELRDGMKPDNVLAALKKNPPGAVVITPRMIAWLKSQPKHLEFLTRHYLPYMRQLWLPGMSSRVAAGETAEWTVPADGLYAIYASPALANHPWFAIPLVFSSLHSRPLPPAATLHPTPADTPQCLLWNAGTNRIVPRENTLQLNRGMTLRATNQGNEPIGIFLVKAGASLSRKPFEFPPSETDINTSLSELWGPPAPPQAAGN